MKRTILYILLTLLLCGCSAEKGLPLGFCYREVTITPGAEAGPILYDLGQPIASVQAPSCAFEGLETTYYHEGLYIDTFQMDGREYIFKAWFGDDTVSTPEGVRIGMEAGEAQRLLGGTFQDGVLTIRSGGTMVTVLEEDGKVTAVTYSVDG